MTDHLINATHVQAVRGVVTVANAGGVVVEATTGGPGEMWDARVDLPHGQRVWLDDFAFPDKPPGALLEHAARLALAQSDADAG